MGAALTLASISWNPEIRNILSLTVGIGVLIGSVYLILATNLGHRLGVLIALAGLFGWLTIMGVTWWMYGIGMKGEAAHWKVIEINSSPLSESQLPQAQHLPAPSDLPDPQDVLAAHPELAAQFEPAPGEVVKPPTLADLVEADPSLKEELKLDELLGGWQLLLPSDSQRGDAVASADIALGPDGENKFTDASSYLVLNAYTIGGKDRLEGDEPCKPLRIVNAKWSGCGTRISHRLDSVLHWTNPPHYAAVQVQQVVPQEVSPGDAPPTPEADTSKPVYTVILERDVGDKRFPAFMVTLVFGILFALTCNVLHRRDKAATLARAAAGE